MVEEDRLRKLIVSPVFIRVTCVFTVNPLRSTIRNTHITTKEPTFVKEKYKNIHFAKLENHKRNCNSFTRNKLIAVTLVER